MVKRRNYSIRHVRNGDKIKLKTGQTVIFEDYDITDSNNCFVIFDPDYECKGGQLIKLSDIESII